MSLPRASACAVALALMACANEARADTGTWFVGLDGAFATADFPTGSVGGFGGGAHLGVGVSDAFNVRVQLDVAHFEGIGVVELDEAGA